MPVLIIIRIRLRADEKTTDEHIHFRMNLFTILALPSIFIFSCYRMLPPMSREPAAL